MFSSDIKDVDNDSDSSSDDDSDDDDKSKEKKEKVPKKPLTQEDILRKVTKKFEKAKEMITILLTLKPRDLEKEDAPFTEEFRQTLLSVSKGYFALKIGRFPVDAVFGLRDNVSGE